MMNFSIIIIALQVLHVWCFFLPYIRTYKSIVYLSTLYIFESHIKLFMDVNQVSNLVKQTKELIQHQATESDKFQQFYQSVRNQFALEAQNENLANKTGTLTSSQLYMLRSQILAYKHLVRNLPVPTGLNSFGMQANTWVNQRQRLTQKAAIFYRDKIEKQAQLKNMILGKIGLKKDEQGQQKYYIEQVKNYVDKRKLQIQHILDKSDQLSDDTKLRLTLELKFLGLKDIYFRIRDKIVENLLKQKGSFRIFERQLLDRSYFRKEKPIRNRDNGIRGQKLQNQMKSDHQRRKRIKHKQFIQQLCIHHNEFFQFHKKKAKLLKKRVTQAKNYYQLNSKSKQTIQNARLEALKKHDMDSYLKLVKETKNLKIQQLLQQTNNFLKQLGAKVLLQKGENPDQTDDIQIKGNKQQDVENNFLNANKIYYNLTHTIKQQITRQPTLLQGGDLKHYQIIGLQWLVSLYNNNLNGILADQMGLGKTIQTISLFAHLIQFKKNYGPFLIVVPLSTISNWIMEFDKWAPSIKKILYRGSQPVRNQISKQLKTTKWNVCITTYQYILKDRLKLNKYQWKYIVIDQGHRMKNAKSKFAGILGQQYQSTHRLLLTGTPLQNNLGELWALLNFLLPKVFSSCDDFEKWFSMPIAKGAQSQTTNNLTQQEQLLIINRLHQVLRPFLLRRVKKQVESQLPDKRQHVIKVELSSWQKLLYNNISKKGAMQFDPSNSKINSKAMMNLMMQLRKCCNHPYLFLNNYDDLIYHDYIFRSSGKFELLDRILPKLISFKHRILIFSQMTHLMDIMQLYFEYRGIKHLRLDGSTKADDRGQRTNLFNKQNSQYDVFLLSTRAGGLGLNLQTADTVIIFDSDWNPQMDLQAQDRAHRIGQKKQVLVLRFITNTWIQEEILSKAAYKMNLDQIFIQGGLYNLKSSEAERRQKIQDLLKKKNIYEEAQNQQIPGDQIINKYLSRDEIQFEAFSKMDQERYQMDAISGKYSRFTDPRLDTKKVNYRLLGEDEIPQWLNEPQKTEQQVKQYGRGNRQRKQVNYTDDMSDQQFLKIIQQQQEEAQQLRQQLKKKSEGINEQGKSSKQSS